MNSSIWMKPGSAYGVQEATAIVGLESRNGWNKPPIAMAAGLAFWGEWQPGERFEYALAQGGFKSQSYIKVMDWMALKAAQTLAQTGRLTVVVQDNGSLHTSLLVRQQWSRWQELGLFVFFLPPYCSEMNPIETQWHQLKSHEIAGQMFDNEYDLAMAVIDGMKARSEAGQYTLERFIFNCT